MSNKTKSQAQQQNRMVLVGIVGVVIVVLLVAIFALSQDSRSLDSAALAEVPKTRTDDGGFVLGFPDAPITIVEFADFLCPACQQYKPTVNRIVEEFVLTGQAKLEYRTLVTAGGASTRLAGHLAECADDMRPGAFWDAYEIFYSMGGDNSLRLQNAGQVFAERIGMNYGELLNCTRTAGQVDIDERLARQVGATGTPTIVIRYGNGAPVPAPYGRNFDGLARAIEEAQ